MSSTPSPTTTQDNYFSPETIDVITDTTSTFQPQEEYKSYQSYQSQKEEKKSDTSTFVNSSDFASRQYVRDLKKIKKEAGLLDDPSNLLNIGTVYYYNNKKMENLTDYAGQKKLKKEFEDKIIEDAENAFTDFYDYLDSDDNLKDLSQKKKQQIARGVMKMKLLEIAETEKLLFPFLD